VGSLSTFRRLDAGSPNDPDKPALDSPRRRGRHPLRHQDRRHDRAGLEDRVGELIDVGLSVARINFSHGVEDDHRRRVLKVREAAAERRAVVGILADIQGPKLRLGSMPGGESTSPGRRAAPGRGALDHGGPTRSPSISRASRAV